MHSLPPHHTPVRRWQPMTDAEWSALLPHVIVQHRPGRPLRDARRRMDAVFWVAAAGCRWADLPARFGKPDTVHRHFRRLAHAGLWQRLLRALARPDRPDALASLAHFVVRACRRATRIAGLAIVVLARRLGLLSALRAPSVFLPDPDLSEAVRLSLRAELEARGGDWTRLPRDLLDGALWLLRAAGRRRIPAHLAPA